MSNGRAHEAGVTKPLSEVNGGLRVEVVAYVSNGRRSQRLAELGLTPGTTIRILRAAGSQPLLICVRGTHLAIDRKTAESITVRVLHGHRRRGRGLRGWRRHLHRRQNRHDRESL